MSEQDRLSYIIAPPARWHRVAFRQHDLQGRCLFVHRCRDKPRLPFTPSVAGSPGSAFGYSTTQNSKTGRMIRDDRLPHEWLVHQAVAHCASMLRPSSQLAWRPGTQDEDIWREVTLLDCYRLSESFEPGSVVVDIGCHAGFFSHLANKRGAIVHAYDADKMNFLLAQSNLNRRSENQVFHAAVWDRDEPLCLHQAGVEKTGDGQVVIPEADLRSIDLRSIDLPSVPVVVFTEVLSRACEAAVDRRVTLLKLDCEGAEWRLLASDRLECVDSLAGEYHLFPSAPAFASPTWLRDRLRDCGFSTVEVTEPVDGLGMFFARRRADATSEQ